MIPLGSPNGAFQEATFFCRLNLRYEDEINLKVFKPNKIKTSKQESHQNSDGTELIDGRILLLVWGSRKNPPFILPTLLFHVRFITDPLLVCLYLVPQMGRCSSSLPSSSPSKLWMLIWAVYSPLRSSNCLNWNGYCKWVGVVFFFFFPLSMSGQPVQCVSWSQQLNLLNYTLLSLALSFSLLLWLQSLLEGRKTSLALTW